MLAEKIKRLLHPPLRRFSLKQIPSEIILDAARFIWNTFDHNAWFLASEALKPWGVSPRELEYLSKAHEMGGTFRGANQSAASYDTSDLSIAIYPAFSRAGLYAHARFAGLTRCNEPIQPSFSSKSSDY